MSGIGSRTYSYKKCSLYRVSNLCSSFLFYNYLVTLRLIYTKILAYCSDERIGKFSVFDFPENSPNVSFVSNSEINIDEQGIFIFKIHELFIFFFLNCCSKHV